MPFRSRLARRAFEALTSGFGISMHYIASWQTSRVVDTSVSIGAGAFVAAAALGIVLIHGTCTLPLLAAAVPLAVIADHSRFYHRRARFL